MKRIFILFCTVMLLIPALAACGNSQSNGPVTLRFATWGGSIDIKDMISQFQKDHPNIKVELEVIPSNEYWTKIDTAATGGNAPDVFWMNGPNFIKYASNNVIMPLDDFIQADKLSLGNYPSSLVSLYTYNGKHYALPKDFDTIALWYNKKLFDEAGVKYPDATWTWDTLREAAKKLTNPAKEVWGIGAMLDEQQNYYNTIFQNGGYVISPDKKTSGYDQPATIEGLKFWTDLIQAGYSPTLAQMEETSPQDMFETGKIAMFYGGSWNTASFGSNSYTRDNADVTILPKGKVRATVIHGLSDVIFSGTKYPQQAWELVKFLSSKQAAQIEDQTGVVIPAYNGMQEGWTKAFPQFHLQAYLDELAYAVPYPVSKNTSAWLSVQDTLLTKVWAGQMDLNTGAKQLAQQMNQLLVQEQSS